MKGKEGGKDLGYCWGIFWLGIASGKGRINDGKGWRGKDWEGREKKEKRRRREIYRYNSGERENWKGKREENCVS